MNRLTTAHRLALTASLLVYSLTADAGPKFTLDINPWAVGGPSCRWWSPKLRTVACIVEEDGADGPRRGIRFVNETESKIEWLPKPDSPDAETALKRLNERLKDFIPVYHGLSEEESPEIQQRGEEVTVSFLGDVVAVLHGDPDCKKTDEGECLEVGYLPSRLRTDLAARVAGFVIATYRAGEYEAFPLTEQEWDKMPWSYDRGPSAMPRIVDIRVAVLPLGLQFDVYGNPEEISRTRLDAGFPLGVIEPACLWTAGTSVLCVIKRAGCGPIDDYGLALVDLKARKITKVSWLARYARYKGEEMCDKLVLDRAGLAAWNKAISKFRPAPVFFEARNAPSPESQAFVLAPGVTLEWRQGEHQAVLVRRGKVVNEFPVPSDHDASISFTGTEGGYLLVVSCPDEFAHSDSPLDCPWKVVRVQ